MAKYIGQSIDRLTRWKQHKRNAKKRSDTYFYRALREFGEKNFSFSVILETSEKLDYYEKLYIKLYHSNDKDFGYNLTEGGQLHGWKEFNERVKNGEKTHPMKNHNWTDEQRKNMSQSRKGKYKGEDHYLSKMTNKEKIDFVKSKCGTFTALWWNNGVEQIRSFECPGEGWVRGQCIKNSSWGCSKGTHWYNNGKVSIRSKVCPKGFTMCKLKRN